MTSEQKALVQSSFSQVMLISHLAAGLFYDRLFELDPTLRALFKSDMREQQRKLMQMLEVVVKGLDNLDTLIPAVEALGKRHVSYGVTEDHYETVGRALIDTLETGLGSKFTPNVREAWMAAYGLLASVMKQSTAAAIPEVCAV
ncbi:MAG TPA: globin family protein [Blastocatellia bacterium]|nr:globin family protein [Blastocatellia bacterium]